MLVDPADIPTIGKFDDAELDLLMYELKADLNAYFARLGRRLLSRINLVLGECSFEQVIRFVANILPFAALDRSFEFVPGAVDSRRREA